MAKKSKIDQALTLTAGIPRERPGTKRANFAKKANDHQNQVADMLDTLAAVKRAAPKLFDFLQGKIPADVAFSSIAPASLMKLVEIMGGGESEKNQLDAAKHLLALAGHTPTQKHEIGRVDASTPKEALVSLIMGNKKNLEASGIEVEDDEPEDKT